MAICSVVSFGILVFFAKRHRNPRLRPRRGEVILVGIILFMGSGFFSHFTAELLSTDFDEERLKNNMRASQARGLSDPTGSGVRRDRINDLQEPTNDLNGDLSTESPDEFIDSSED